MGFGSDGVDIARTDTQVFDGHLSPPSFSGEDMDKASYSPRTVHFDDTEPVDDDEMQVVNLAGETQVFDIGGETQVMCFGGETQLLDDPNYMDFDTQILDDFDNALGSDSCDDGTGITEILVGDDLSDDGSLRSFEQSVDQEKGRFASICENDRKVSEQLRNDFHDQKYNSGSIRFTSVRTASLRASGLAAQNFLLQSDSKEKLSINNNHVDRHIDLEQSCENAGELGNIKHRVGSSAMRKLFTEDSTPVGDARNLDTSDVIGGLNPLQSTACDDQLAGLSYVDSQEPGDLTQQDALDFVDKLIKDSNMEFDQGCFSKKASMVQSKSVPNPKGQYDLANIIKHIRPVGKSRIFDWDDNREDEGGGDIFCRRKDEFFGSVDGGKISLTEPRISKGRRLDSYGDKGGFLNIQNTKSRLCYSDSRVRLSKERENNEPAREVNGKYKKNLSNKLVQQTDSRTCGGKLEDNCIESDDQQFSNVGFDTQMAAEAMEALFHNDNTVKCVDNESDQHLQNALKDSCRGSAGKPDGNLNLGQTSSSKRGRSSSAGFVSRQSKKKKTVKTLRNQHSVLSHKSSESLMKENASVKMSEKGRTDADEIRGNRNMGHANRGSTVHKQLLCGEVEFAPIARRTRHSMTVNQLKKGKRASGEYEQLNHFTDVGPLNKKRSRQSMGDSKAKKTKTLEAVSGQPRERKIPQPSRSRILNSKLTEGDAAVVERSSCAIVSGEASPSDNLLGQTVNRRKRSCNMKKARTLISLNENLERPTLDGEGAENTRFGSRAVDMNDKVSDKDPNETSAVQKLNKKSDGSVVSSVEKTASEESPVKRGNPPDIVCTTPPDDCRTPINAVSPVCMGNEYYKQSCQKNLMKSCLLNEVRKLSATGFAPGSLSSESRKRKDMNGVRVLYSNHLDEDIVKQQKKTLARLGITLASSITDATHFVTDKFVRTRNMLEAIAIGKLVVTHLWIESCGQASCFIDEKNYILRDAKKEKEFGFSMPASLARAREHSLLQGRRVLITQNTKPGKEIISSLVKAVKGQAVERIGRSVMKDDQIPDDLLVLSCEEDYDICTPFLEKGAAVYSSELLLNGIVTQKLEFERHRLFVDHVKRTRSTIWLKKDGNQFHPVTKHQ